MTKLSATEHAGLIAAFSDLAGELDTLIIDTAAGISDEVISFTKAAQDVLVVVCDEPTSLTDAYALIKVLSREHGIQRFHVLANMVRSAAEGRELFAKLNRVTDRYLDIVIDFAGAVPFDDYLRKAVQKQNAVCDMFPNSPASLSFRNLAKAVSNWPTKTNQVGNMTFFLERLIHAAPQSQGV